MLARSLVATSIVVAMTTALVLVTAGTVHFWQAWAYFTVSFILSVAITADLALHDPELLARRRRIGPRAETEPTQRLIIRLVMVTSIAAPLVAGLDHRFGWSHMPDWTVWLGLACLIAGNAGIFWVFRSNSFAAGTVAAMEGQRVVDSGPYALVRHPMYSAMIPMTAAIGLSLGSWWALAPAAMTTALFAWRLVDEERVLLRDLPGYADYRRKVRWRLAPFVW